MNQDLFRYHHRPYTASPDTANFVSSESTESALKTIESGVVRGAGPSLVIAPSGLGKSMVCAEINERLKEHFEMVFLATSRLCTRRALLQNLLYELGLPYRDMEEGELRLSLLEHIKNPKVNSHGVVLLVDEAHTMPLRLLEELRGLTNITRDGQPRVHLVLAGTQQLDERLNSPKMEAFSQRIAARCYLHPLNRDETYRFVSHQWVQASKDSTPLPFDESALNAVYAATDGIPRLINQLCDHALAMANVEANPSISEAEIEAAWSDLQQLPTPWQVNYRPKETQSDQSQTVIEFGTLNSDLQPHEFDEQQAESSSIGRALDRLEQLDELTSQAYSWDVSDDPLAVQTEEAAADTDIEDSLDSPETSLFPATRLLEQSELDSITDQATEALKAQPPTVAPNPFADDEFEAEEVVSEQVDPSRSAPMSQQVEDFSAIANTEEADDSSATDTRSMQATVTPDIDEDISLNAFDEFDSMEATDQELEAIESARNTVSKYIDDDLSDSQGAVNYEMLADQAGPDTNTSTHEADNKAAIDHDDYESITEQFADAESEATDTESETPHRASLRRPHAVPYQQDDKDMILVENPTEASDKFRIVAAPEQETVPASNPPQGRAYRENYQTLLARLRGDQND